MSIKSELEKLRTVDIYSLLLFVLFKIKDVKEYSTLSELMYVLDKDNFLNLCEYFGGLTITIPTITELEQLVNALLLYQYVDLEKMSYKEAVKQIGFKSYELRQIKSNYRKIKEVLSDYSFTKD